MSRFLSGANRTAQYYQASYPSAATFTRIDKLVLHTTETTGWPGYGGGASAPNATYHPRLREIRQHFDNNRSARALRDPSSTLVRENRDNVFQLEIICYSDKRLGDSVGGLWVGDLTDTHMRDIAAIAVQLHQDWDLPLQSTVTWREGRETYYDNVRLTGPQFDAYRGVLGHVHVSGNSHWNPGGFRYSRLERHLTGDDGMPLNSDDLAKIRKVVQDELARSYTHTGPPKTTVSTRHGGRYGFLACQRAGQASVKADAILDAVKAIPGVDGDALAAKVAEAVERLDAETVAGQLQVTVRPEELPES